MYSTFHFKVVSLLRHKQIKQNPIISNHVMYGILKGGKSVQNWGKPLVFPNGLFYDSLRFLRSTGCFPNIPPQPTNRSPAKPRFFSQIRLTHLIQGQLGYTAQTSGGSWMSRWKLGSMV